MSRQEKIRYIILVVLRILSSVIDFIGILAVGFLAISVTDFLTQGGQTNRAIQFAGIKFDAITMQAVPLAAVAILFLFIFKAIGSIWLTQLTASMLANIEARSAREITQNTLANNFRHSQKFSNEEHIFAVQIGSSSIFNIILNYSATIAAEIFLFIFIFSAFIIVNPIIALVTFLYFVGVGMLIQFFLGRSMIRAGEISTKSTLESNTILTDFSVSLREAMTLGRSDYFLNKIFLTKSLAANSHARLFVLSGLPRYIIETSLIIGVTAFILIQSTVGDLTSAAGTVGVFLTGGLRMTASLLPLQTAILQVKGNLAAGKKALDLLDNRQIEVIAYGESFKTINNTYFSPDQALSVTMKNISFRYGEAGANIIQDINLEILPGQQVAIIGPSGAGKSTLVDLILGLLIPDAGSVEISGLDPRQIISSYPGVISYVPQVPGIVSGSIARNIAYGLEIEDIDWDRLDKVIVDSHLKELVNSLPAGIHTDLGKRRDKLSGGQLQRIGVARALYFQPRLLILDEATNSLDADSENEITKVLNFMHGQVTIILIAHNLKTIQYADTVCLMESGKIIDQGKFSEVCERNQMTHNFTNFMTINGDLGTQE